MQLSSGNAPPAVRWIVGSALAMIFAGAIYLIAVRGDAILADLAGIAAWCF